MAVPKLRNNGVRRVHCRYDGGNDEGFSWLDGAEVDGAGRINRAALLDRLRDTHFMDEIDAIGAVARNAQ